MTSTHPFLIFDDILYITSYRFNKGLGGPKNLDFFLLKQKYLNYFVLAKKCSKRG